MESIKKAEIKNKIKTNANNYSEIFEIDSVDKIISLYKELGNANYIGEAISQEEHAVQAALLAKEENSQEAVILGALLHDIGHLLGLKFCLEMMDNLGCKAHETLGSLLLEKVGFSRVVCDVVENHVETKRFLVSKYPQYYEKLSEASKGTLVHQGGKMCEEEMLLFEQEDNFDVYVLMRSWDERAKVKDMILPSIESFREMMINDIKNNDRVKSYELH